MGDRRILPSGLVVLLFTGIEVDAAAAA